MTDTPKDPLHFEGSIDDQPEPLPASHRRGARVAIALVVAVLLAAGGALVALRASGGVDLAARVPGDVTAFVSFDLRPSGDQQEAIEALLGRLPEDKRADVLDAIDDGLEQVFAETGLSFANDIKPWVGPNVGVVVPKLDASALTGGPPVVGLVSVRDEAGARETLQRLVNAGDIGAFDIVEGVAYIAGRRSMITSLVASAEEGSTLADESRFAEAGDRFGGLMVGWFNADGLGSLLESFSGGVPGAGPLGAQPSGLFTFGLSVTPEGVVLEGEQTGAAPSAEVASARPALLESTSAGLLGAFTLVDLAGGIEAALNGLESSGFGGLLPFDISDPLGELGFSLRDDLLPWLHGELSVLVGGFSTSGPEVGVLVDPTDEAAAARTLRKLRTVADGMGAVVAGKPGGFDAAIPSLGVTIAVRQGDDRVVIAGSPDYADRLLVRAADALADDEVYRSTVGGSSDEVVSQAFIRLDRIRDLARSFLSAEERAVFEEDVDPFLSLFQAVGMRVVKTADGGSFVARLTAAE